MWVCVCVCGVVGVVGVSSDVSPSFGFTQATWSYTCHPGWWPLPDWPRNSFPTDVLQANQAGNQRCLSFYRVDEADDLREGISGAFDGLCESPPEVLPSEKLDSLRQRVSREDSPGSSEHVTGIKSKNTLGELARNFADIICMHFIRSFHICSRQNTPTLPVDKLP